MTAWGWLEIALLLGVLLALVRPLGWYMARVYDGRGCGLDVVLRPVERGFYALLGRAATAEMSWRTYAAALLTFNMLGLIALYVLQRVQDRLPFNPQGLPAVPPDLALNTAISFATNTNWQAYGGETTLSYLTQMAGLTVQNFVSAATGMAVLAALVRGFTRQTAATIGNFWVDLTRGTLYILLPLALLLAVALASQGVVQTFAAYRDVPLVKPVASSGAGGDAGAATRSASSGEQGPLARATLDPHGPEAHAPQPDGVAFQSLPLGPVASQVAIKQLGTNGGGVFNVNSAHPFENPTPLSNFLELLAILLIPAALCLTLGCLVNDPRQGWALLATMFVIFLPLLVLTYWAESHGNPRLAALGVDQAAGPFQSGGNMKGKETRFGVADSALWAAATTAASNGSVNSMHDSFTPLGVFPLLLLMQLGEVSFGGVGSGLYGLLVFAIVAVFVAGLMVGRTPEFLGKKIEAFEMKMASLVILTPCAVVLVGTALALSTDAGRAGVFNPGPRGFTEVLYAFTSAGNNNGSALAGLSANSVFYNVAIGVAMFLGRYFVIIPVLAIAGALAAKKRVPVTSGTLPTHTPLFVALLVAVVLVVGALTFIPSLALGPIVEHLMFAG